MTVIKAEFGNKQEKKLEKKKDKPEMVYQFHVSLAFSDPLIWRRIQIPGKMTLKQFHLVLQLCMRWTGEHNHQFYVGKVFYNSSKSSGDPRFYEGSVELESLDEAMRWCFTYMYDAGDGWEHEIVLEESRPAAEKDILPIVLDGEWAAPPEEIGSVHVYEKVLWAIENPNEEGSKALLQYHQVEDFDPYQFDRNTINSQLKKIKIEVR